MADFYQSLPNDRAESWFEEFSAEVVSDHRQLLACRDAREGRSGWSFDHAVKRTREFYQERLNGYHSVGSITQDQLEHLLTMVDALGTPDFPRPE